MDTSTVQACQYLVNLLQTQLPLLDDQARSYLVQARTEIDDALTRKDEPAEKKSVKRKTASTQVLPITDLLQQFQRKKKKAIVAVYPYQELTDGEEKTSVMVKLFGESFTKTWFKWKNVTLTLARVLSAIYLAPAILSLLDFTPALVTLLLTLTYQICNTYFMVWFSSYMNFKIVTLCFKSFDMLYFIVEAGMFASAIWSVKCFTFSGLLLSVSLFLGGIQLLFYDSFPISVRRGLRVVLPLQPTFVFFCLAVLYARVPKNLCFYHFDLFQGLVLEADDEQTYQIEVSKWSFSLFEFCLNRGATLLILLARITYFAFKRPDDCVILNSRVRLVETVIKKSSPTKTQSTNKQQTKSTMDTSTVNACQYLIGLLQSKPLLNDQARSYLVQARNEIENALTSKADKDNQDDAKRRRSHRRMGISHVLPMKDFLPQIRRTKKTSIVAVYPYRELTDEEVQTTVMMKLFGGGFTKRWFNWKKVTLTLARLFSAMFLVPYFLGLLDFTSAVISLLLSLTYLICNTYHIMWFSSYMNLKIFITCFKYFDTLYLMVEGGLFVLALWSVKCFSLSGFIFSVTQFLGVFSFVLYDSLPISLRRASRLVLALVSFAFVLVLALLYSRVPKTMCLYRFDLLQGFVLEADDERTYAIGVSKLSFSLFDFCLNRGFTLFIFASKITYLAFKHPNDCVVLKSRVRLVETVAKEDGNPS